MKELSRYILAFFYPEYCPYCSALIEPDDIACTDCGREVVARSSVIRRGVLGSRCVAPYAYEGRVRKAIINFKFHEMTQHARPLSKVLEDTVLKEYDVDEIDLITYVPMHKKDLLERGFNQSELLAKELSESLHIPYAGVLEKIKHTKKQHRLKMAKRKENLSGAFALKDKEAIKGKTILLIDDVMTSGSTLSHCVKKLYSAKPARVFCAVIASAAEHERKPKKASDPKDSDHTPGFL